MSRVGKNPIPVPKGVEITIGTDSVAVKGPLGTLSQQFLTGVALKRDGEQIVLETTNDTALANAMSGTMRALVANMVTGVSKGFEKKLTLVGVGYRAQAQGDKLNLQVGYSHPVVHEMPAGVKCETPTQTEILIKGTDRQRVGQVAAEVRAYRPPEP